MTVVQHATPVADPRVSVADQRVVRHARRLAERRLDVVLGAIGDAIVIVAADGAVSMANGTAEPLLHDMASRTIAHLLGRFEPESLSLETLILDSPQTLREIGGDRRWFEVSAAVAPSSAGETILVFRDVTAARQRDAIRDSFIGVLSHELRTPLTTIYCGATVLTRAQAGLDAETRAEIAEDIQGEAERLHRLVEDVVALTRFEEGELVVDNDPVLVQRVIPAVLGAEAARWPGGRDVEVAIQPDLPPVGGDATYVEQVLRNLVANARKYGGASGWVGIEAEAADDEVLVRVLDDGPGLADADIPRLFDLYYRSPSLSTAVSGSGIGLFVCDRLVAAMGGRLWGANRADGGAEFGFGLRVLPPDD